MTPPPRYFATVTFIIVLLLLVSLIWQVATADTAQRRSLPRVVAGLLCIHDGKYHRYIGHGDAYHLRFYATTGDAPGNGEGSWTDHNAPQWGGLQMDYGFQRTYGSEFLRHGTADAWPTWVQLRVATRAVLGYHGFSGRSFTPWPHTSRACGLG